MLHETRQKSHASERRYISGFAVRVVALHGELVHGGKELAQSSRRAPKNSTGGQQHTHGVGCRLFAARIPLILGRTVKGHDGTNSCWFWKHLSTTLVVGGSFGCCQDLSLHATNRPETQEMLGILRLSGALEATTGSKAMLARCFW